MIAGKNVLMIVAASDNDVIGNDGKLPWHLSADLKRFRRLTAGHHIIMGRKTFESIGRLLPDRWTVIVTRQPDYFFSGAKIVGNVQAAIFAAGDDDTPFIIGGSEIYRAALPIVSTIHLTRVHVQIDGDTLLPPIDWEQWELISSEHFKADPRNDFNFSLEEYQRISGESIDCGVVA